tara:strand:+ start:1393 stop:2112 length:720 start_codon:yes stop_codon:yes gene_type:complete
MKKIFLSIIIANLSTSLFAIGGFGLSGNQSLFKVSAGNEDIIVEKLGESVKVGEFAYDGFENGYGLGGYLYIDALPYVDLDIEYNFRAQIYEFVFQNDAMELAGIDPDTANFPWLSGSVFYTLQYPIKDIEIPLFGEARLYGGLGYNRNSSIPLVNQEMLESVIEGGVESEEYDPSELTKYLRENQITSNGLHLDAGVFFRLLTFSGAVYYRQVLFASDVIPPDKSSYGSLNFRLGLGI